MLIDWTYYHGDTRHGISIREAAEALSDSSRLTLDPDPASRSGDSLRVIGWSETKGCLISVVLVRDGLGFFAGTAFSSNRRDVRLFNERRES